MASQEVPKDPPKPVERLFPFARRAAVLIIGQDACRGRRKHLLFLLVTDSLSERSRREVERDFASFPMFTCYTTAQLEEYFGCHGTKVLGFRKSSIAQSILQELRERENS